MFLPTETILQIIENTTLKYLLNKNIIFFSVLYALKNNNLKIA